MSRIRLCSSEGELHFFCCSSNCWLIQAFSTNRKMPISPMPRSHSSPASNQGNKVFRAFLGNSTYRSSTLLQVKWSIRRNTIWIELQTYSRIQSRSACSKTPWCTCSGELHKLTPNFSKAMSKGEMDSQLLPEQCFQVNLWQYISVLVDINDKTLIVTVFLMSFYKGM